MSKKVKWAVLFALVVVTAPVAVGVATSSNHYHGNQLSKYLRYLTLSYWLTNNKAAA